MAPAGHSQTLAQVNDGAVIGELANPTADHCAALRWPAVILDNCPDGEGDPGPLSAHPSSPDGNETMGEQLGQIKSPVGLLELPL